MIAVAAVAAVAVAAGAVVVVVVVAHQDVHENDGTLPVDVEAWSYQMPSPWGEAAIDHTDGIESEATT
jgi:hypothetical protein